ncbi:hypothetical protein QOK74_08160 [Staphylococcus saprophyticus]|uniref:hypothetical protein n=1 Tax=Staphylococcus saprophyticus TaxID=29385 RepID=UPI0024C2F11D|nr:hypothetical protein [Staphylococcus saprophyticus]MDK1672844.1 hypothetical protein [Staphylococcus saprophyticus]
MNNIDLTIDKIFSGETEVKSSIINNRIRSYNIKQPSIYQHFETEQDWKFQMDTGMKIRETSNFHKEVMEVELGLRCECCGGHINSLNSIYGLCIECDDRMFNLQNESAAYRDIGFEELKQQRKNKEYRIKTENERVVYTELFLDSY